MEEIETSDTESIPEFPLPSSYFDECEPFTKDQIQAFVDKNNCFKLPYKPKSTMGVDIFTGTSPLIEFNTLDDALLDIHYMDCMSEMGIPIDTESSWQTLLFNE